MLSGTTLQYYLEVTKPSVRTFEESVALIRNRLLTKERTLSLTREWETTKFTNCISKNPGKSPKHAPHAMITQLQELQGCLQQYFRSDELFINKLLNAADGVEACRLARQEP